MKALHKGLFLVPLFAAVAAAPAAAQSWKWDWGVNVGFAHFTNSLGTDQTGLDKSQAAGAVVHFHDGPLVGTQLGFWFSPRFGLRLNGRYADRSLTGNDMQGTAFLNDVNLWAATGDLMFRLKAPAPEFTKMEMLPYLALGVGAKWHDPAGDRFACSETGSGAESFDCSPFVTGVPAQPRGFALGEQTRLAVLAGLGADWRLAKHVALRTEISDLIFKPQIEQAAVPANLDTPVWTVTSRDNVAKMTHEIAGQIGLQFLFGLAKPPVVAVAPPPPPPPAPPPAAPAPPPVSREAMSVCVIDPTAPGGTRMQDAFLVGGKDTVVVVNGADQPFSTAVTTNVPVVTSATWYVQGQPLVMTVGKGRVEYATYGTPRVVSGTDVAYLGTINGMPVYADKDQVTDIVSELNDLNKAQANRDLGDILNQQKDLREALGKVKVLYTPVNATGCVFQAVQRQEEVRKGGNK